MPTISPAQQQQVAGAVPSAHTNGHGELPTATARDPVAEVILRGLDRGVTDPQVRQVIRQAIANAADNGLPTIWSICASGVTLDTIGACIQAAPPVLPPGASVALEVRDVVSPDVLRQDMIAPIKTELPGVVGLAVLDPLKALSTDVVDAITSAPGASNYWLYVALQNDILGYIDALAANRDTGLAPEGGVAAAATIRNDQANQILRDAIAQGATDIHLEQIGERFVIRARINGVLKQMGSAIPLTDLEGVTAATSLINSYRVFGNTGNDELVPGDGYFSFEGHDCRVSYLPGTLRLVGSSEYSGAKIVVRILGRAPSALSELGLPPYVLQVFEAALQYPNGIVLLSGPTGSGKTTSAYAALAHLLRHEQNGVYAAPTKVAYSVEDPPEIVMPGVHQVSVSQRVGFPDALRAFLRADPDVILVGEIRDAVTADIAIQAATAGSFVLSSIHANNAAGVIGRLQELQISPVRVADALRASINQRLPSKLCPQCRIQVEVTDAMWAQMWGSHLPAGIPRPEVLYDAQEHRSCALCGGTGYVGRQVIAEGFAVDSTIREMISSGGDVAHALRTHLTQVGWPDVLRNMWPLVQDGTLSYHEIRHTILDMYGGADAVAARL